ncbi:MAG TPA: hypothetical protein VF516_04210 [Kofleriaceae bacterium]
MRAVAQAYLDSDAFPDQVFDHSAAQSVIDQHFEHGQIRLEEVGMLLTLATASHLLSGDLRTVPAEAQPDLSTTRTTGRRKSVRTGARFESSSHASP